VNRSTTLSRSPSVFAFVSFQLLLTNYASSRPGYAFQASKTDRLFTIDAKAVRPLGYGVERLVQFRQKKLIERIVFAFIYCDCTCLCMYLANEFPALVLDDLPKTEYLFLCEHNAFLDLLTRNGPVRAFQLPNLWPSLQATEAAILRLNYAEK
jgi:hypothetical protein